tara:strand:- start:303 stop:1037 length:735 start_codon:yes stop_codon:yes gene_type:complete
MRSNSKKILGLIGIRSGSTGVKNKNIKNLGGKPLVSWIIKTAKKSKYINRLVISTDSNKYAKIVKKLGAEVPCLRPKNLATKNSPEIKYIKHMLKWLKNNENYTPDIVVRMMSTVPFQKTEDIDKIISHVLFNKKVDSSVVVSEARQHPLKALKIKKKGKNKILVSYIGNKSVEVGRPLSRHIYEPAFFRANVIASKIEVINKKNSLTGDHVKFNIIPQERAVDIDTELDFKITEYLIKNKKIK